MERRRNCGLGSKIALVYLIATTRATAVISCPQPPRTQVRHTQYAPHISSWLKSTHWLTFWVTNHMVYATSYEGGYSTGSDKHFFRYQRKGEEKNVYIRSRLWV
ncbi:hypothetical protein F4823DRAFT_617519 [Ustulina deusta]|nr:hypothetical protein F4823DRAFT_617519 [Ustulina deusta]